MKNCLTKEIIAKEVKTYQTFFITTNINIRQQTAFRNLPLNAVLDNQVKLEKKLFI